MKALLCAITAAALAITPLAAKAQTQDGWRDGGYGQDQRDGHGRSWDGGVWNGGSGDAQARNGGAWNGDAGRGGERDGGAWDGWGRGGGWNGGWGGGFDIGVAPYAYDDGHWGPDGDWGYGEDWQGPPAYAEEGAGPPPAGYGYQGGGWQGGGWSGGAPPPQCGGWFWRPEVGAYRWRSVPCQCPPRAGWGR